MKFYLRKVLPTVFIAVLGLVSVFIYEYWQNTKLDDFLSEMSQRTLYLEEPKIVDNVEYFINPQHIYNLGIEMFNTAALSNPRFDSVFVADTYLSDVINGIAVSINGIDRYYSNHIMNYHLVVNDQIDNIKILVTHCPLCNSSAVYSRVLDGKELNFEITGEVFNNNILMRDKETNSLWLQSTGVAIAGEYHGKKLSKIPSLNISWENWQNIIDDGEALSISNGYDFEYARHPYGNYLANDKIYFPIEQIDTILDQKETVVGIESESKNIAISLEYLQKLGIKQIDIDGKSILLVWDRKIDGVRAFDVSGREFISKKGNIMIDSEGYEWTSDGIWMGEEDISLSEVSIFEGFWMCWIGFHPESELIIENLD